MKFDRNYFLNNEVVESTLNNKGVPDRRTAIGMDALKHSGYRIERVTDTYLQLGLIKRTSLTNPRNSFYHVEIPLSLPLRLPKRAVAGLVLHLP